MTRAVLLIVTFALGLAVGAFIDWPDPSVVIQDEGPGITGIGGVFFRADNPTALRQWYEQDLGIEEGQPGVNFFWREPNDHASFGLTVWSVFPSDTDWTLHPAPVGCELEALELRDPDAVRLRDIARVLDLDVRIVHSDTSRLSVGLRCWGGEIEI